MKFAYGIFAWFWLSTSAFGQGTVAFNNLGSTNYQLLTYCCGLPGEPGNVTNVLAVPHAYRIGLYVALGAGQPEGALQLVGLATNGPAPAVAAYFAGGNPFTLPSGYAQEQIITFQLRAWSLNYSTFEAAYRDFPFSSLGVSLLGYTVLGGGTTPAGALFGAAPGQLSTGFAIHGAVPEPSTWAIALLSATIGCVVLRCRKRSDSR